MDLTQRECCFLLGTKACSAGPLSPVSCCWQNYKPAVPLISKVEVLCIYKGSTDYHCHHSRVSSAGFPKPHLCLCLAPNALCSTAAACSSHILLSPLSRLRDADRPHSAPSLSVAPCLVSHSPVRGLMALGWQ